MLLLLVWYIIITLLLLVWYIIITLAFGSYSLNKLDYTCDVVSMFKINYTIAFHEISVNHKITFEILKNVMKTVKCMIRFFMGEVGGVVGQGEVAVKDA